jgi:hypothetical protein
MVTAEVRLASRCPRVRARNQGDKSLSRVIDSLPELELKTTVYPKAEVLYMPTIKERVPVFQGRFRIRQEVKVSSMAEFRNSLGTDGYVHPSSKIRFVACRARR